MTIISAQKAINYVIKKLLPGEVLDYVRILKHQEVIVADGNEPQLKINRLKVVDSQGSEGLNISENLQQNIFF